MSADGVRRAYGLGPRIKPEPPGPSPLWQATQQARDELRTAEISFANQEATETELLAAARKLRNLQQQWGNSGPAMGAGAPAACASLSFPNPAAAGAETGTPRRAGAQARPRTARRTL